MSQFFVQGTSSSGPLPPNVPTSFVTDSGTVIPAANVVNINGGSTPNNVANGIQVIANPTGSNNEVVQLTNRITGSATTTDGTTPMILYSFPLGAVAGTYLFTQNVVAYNKTAGLGAVYVGFRGIRTNGGAGFLINSNIALEGEEGLFSLAEVVNGIAGNNATLTVTGLAGQTIDWYTVTTYILVV